MAPGLILSCCSPLSITCTWASPALPLYIYGGNSLTLLTEQIVPIRYRLSILSFPDRRCPRQAPVRWRKSIWSHQTRENAKNSTICLVTIRNLRCGPGQCQIDSSLPRCFPIAHYSRYRPWWVQRGRKVNRRTARTCQSLTWRFIRFLLSASWGWAIVLQRSERSVEDFGSLWWQTGRGESHLRLCWMRQRRKCHWTQ